MRPILPEFSQAPGKDPFQSVIGKINFFLLINMILVIITGIIFDEQIVAGSFVLESMIFLITLGWVGIQGLHFKDILSIKAPNIKEVGLTLVIVITGIYVASYTDQFFRYFLQNLGAIPELQIPVPRNSKELMLSIIGFALLPAVAEETLFRGFILKSYARYISAGSAIFITALFFGMAHLSVNNFWGPFILGLICGWLVVSFNSIFLAIFAHFLNNCLTIILLYYYPAGRAVKPITLTEILVSLPFFVIAGLILLMMLLRFKPHYNPLEMHSGTVVMILKHWSTWFLLIVFSLFAILELLMISGKIA